MKSVYEEPFAILQLAEFAMPLTETEMEAPFQPSPYESCILTT